MTVRKKLTLSTLIMAAAPALLALCLCIGYLLANGDIYLNPQGSGGEAAGSLSGSQNVLYLYENETAALDWAKVADLGEEGADYLPTPQRMLLSELAGMGYHLHVENEEGLLFTNLDDNDRELLRQYGAEELSGGSMLEADGRILIRETVSQNGVKYHVTAVYEEARADASVQESVLPVYRISPAELAALLLALLACVFLVNGILTGWIGRSILRPLSVLREGSKEILNGNLDVPVVYDYEDEFGEVCREFDGMRKKLLEADQVRAQYEEYRKELLAGISHDLRSPLTSIKGYAEGLRDGIADTEEKRRRYYDAILTRTGDLERLTGSLTTLIRMEREDYRFQTERVNLHGYLTELLREMDPYTAEHQVEITYTNRIPEREADLDIREFRRVLDNLIDNTIKYRRSDRSAVRLEVAEGEKKTELVLNFSDDGPGVRKDQLDRIFDSFYRGDEARANPGNGSGLGLAVVKRIIEGHGGSVAAYTDGGLGIRITLPAAEE